MSVLAPPPPVALDAPEDPEALIEEARRRARRRRRRNVTRWVTLALGVVVLLGAAAALLVGSSASRSAPGAEKLVGATRLPGGTILFARNRGIRGVGLEDDVTYGLFAMSPNGGDVRQLIGAPTCCVSWSGSSRRVVLAMLGGSTPVTATMRSDGSDLVIHARSPVHDLTLVPAAWAPDGGMMVFEGWSATDPSRDGVYTGLPDGRNLFRVTHALGRRDRPLSFSPDGSHLLIYRRASGRTSATLEVIGRDGSGEVRLTPPGAHEWCCYFGQPGSWSPDGRRIAFAAYQPGLAADPSRSAVFVADADGSHRHRISAWGGWTPNLQWSPDGRWIAFERLNRYSAHDLFIIHPDGTGERMIPTGTDGGSCCVTWSPEGSELLYQHGPNDQQMALFRVAIAGDTTPHKLTGFGPYLTAAWIPKG